MSPTKLKLCFQDCEKAIVTAVWTKKYKLLFGFSNRQLWRSYPRRWQEATVPEERNGIIIGTVKQQVREKCILRTGENKLLTSRDIQDIFSMGKNQAYALMHSAGFPTTTIGNRMFVTQVNLEKWLEVYKGRQYLV